MKLVCRIKIREGSEAVGEGAKRIFRNPGIGTYWRMETIV
jgi:hypothetical protein